MFEAEVLDGRALLLLSVPDEVQTRASLEELFRVHFKGTAAAVIQDIHFNQPCKLTPVSSNAGDVTDQSQTREEVAAVLFERSEAVRTVLQRVRVVSSGVAYELELRRGYLTLGSHCLLVEGVLGLQETVLPYATTRVSVQRVSHPSPRIDAAVDMNVSADVADNNEVTPSRAEHAERTEIQRDSAALLFTFVLLGVRRMDTSASTTTTTKDGSGEDNKGAHHGLVTPFKGQMRDFALTPYMVYQTLRGECLPRNILVLTPKTIVRCEDNTTLPVTHVLVQLESTESAQELCQKMHGTLLELMSPLPRSYRVGRSTLRDESCAPRGWQTLTVQEPCVEAQFRLFVRPCNAAEEAQGQLAWGRQRHDHTARRARGVGEARPQPRNTRNALCLNHHNIGMVGCIFPRQWYAKATRATQSPHLPTTPPAHLAQVPQLPSSCAEKATRYDIAAQTRSSAQMSSPRQCNTSVAINDEHDILDGERQPRHHDHRHHNEHRHRRRRYHSPPPSPHSGLVDGGDSSARKLSRHDLATPAEPHEVKAALDTAGLQCSGYGDGVSRGSATDQSNVTVAAAVGSLTCLPTMPSIAMASLPAYDSLGPLPSGWRPVFSLEYQETYYVYRDPHTGMETTTWTRPV